MIDSMKW